MISKGRKVKHSKIKNTGIIFECLMRQVTADVISGQKKSYALDILKKNFNEHTELGKEIILYTTLLNEKFDTWAPILMAMLVKIAYDKCGLVNDCEEVLCASNKYRQNQDYLAQFVKEKIVKRSSDDDDVPLKKMVAWSEFQMWYKENHGKNIPKQRELMEHLEKALGRLEKGKWKKYKLIYDDEEET